MLMALAQEEQASPHKSYPRATRLVSTLQRMSPHNFIFRSTRLTKLFNARILEYTGYHLTLAGESLPFSSISRDLIIFDLAFLHFKVLYLVASPFPCHSMHLALPTSRTWALASLGDHPSALVPH